MNKREFFSIYLDALEKALDNDHHNYGFLVWSPEYYMESETVASIDKFIEDELPDDSFLDFVAYYFDAKSHNFPDVGDISIEGARSYIIDEMARLRREYSL